METVRVNLGERAYDILIGRDLLKDAGSAIRGVVRGRKVLLACDSSAESPWGEKVADSLAGAGFDVVRATVPSGERSKCPAQLARLWDVLANAKFSRDSFVVALGGGVVGDLMGFVAASFLRGIDFVQVPTTLLAMVDSSVGGKTGINLDAGKNLVGAFWQPRLVIADLDCLGTLPPAERNSGMAEVIKYGVIRDAEFFGFLEKNSASLFQTDRIAALTHVIKRSVEIKADVVTTDEREDGLRRILNFGHTLGHAVEAQGHYTRYRHGEAIAIGMVAASLLTVRRGGGAWTMDDHQRLERVIAASGLPTRIPRDMATAALIDRTRVDKKVVGGTVRYILPTRMGEVETVNDVTEEQVAAAIAAVRG